MQWRDMACRATAALSRVGEQRSLPEHISSSSFLRAVLTKISGHIAGEMRLADGSGYGRSSRLRAGVMVGMAPALSRPRARQNARSWPQSAKSVFPTQAQEIRVRTDIDWKTIGSKRNTPPASSTVHECNFILLDHRGKPPRRMHDRATFGRAIADQATHHSFIELRPSLSCGCKAQRCAGKSRCSCDGDFDWNGF